MICIVNPYFHSASFELKQISKKPSDNLTPKIPHISSTSYIKSIVDNLRCFSKIKEILKKAMQNNFPDILKSYQLKISQKQVVTAERKYLSGNSTKDYVSDASVSSYQDELSRVVTYLKSQNITVIICTYPTLINRDNLDKYLEIFLDNRRYFPCFSLNGMVDVVEKYNQATINVSKQQGVLLFDAYNEIPKSTEYFGDNVHYTDKGASLFAKGIALIIKHIDDEKSNTRGVR